MQHEMGEGWLEGLDLFMDDGPDGPSPRGDEHMVQSQQARHVDDHGASIQAATIKPLQYEGPNPSTFTRPFRRRKYPCLDELRKSSTAQKFDVVNRRKWNTTGIERPIVLTKTEMLREEQRRALPVPRLSVETQEASSSNHAGPSSSDRATVSTWKPRRPAVPLVLPSPSGQQAMLLAPSPLPADACLSARGEQALFDALGSPCDMALLDFCFSPANGLDGGPSVLSPGTCDRLYQMDFSPPDGGDGVSIATTDSNNSAEGHSPSS